MEHASCHDNHLCRLMEGGRAVILNKRPIEEIDNCPPKEEGSDCSTVDDAAPGNVKEGRAVGLARSTLMPTKALRVASRR